MSDFTNQPLPPPPPQGSPPPFPHQPPQYPQFPHQSPPQYPQQYPQQPQYGVYQPQGVYPFPAQGRTNGLAIASMVLGIVWIYWIGSILAVIFGHVALNQMKKDPTQRGRGMAIAGLVLGYIGIGLLVISIMVAAASTP